MKKILTFIVLLFFAHSSHTQVVYSANFDDGTFGGMTIVDNDGLEVASGLAFFDDAWTVSNSIFEEAFDIMSTGVLSHSRYMPVGTSDDWLISPQMTIEEFGTAVLWKVRSLSVNSRASMEVRVSTTDNNLSSFTDVIYSSEEELPVLTQKLASLNDYVGEQIYIAFINNSTDKYLVLVDDIIVQPIGLEDITITSFVTNPYQLKNQEFDIEIRVENNGGDTLKSFDFVWSYGTDEYRETLTGLSLPTGESQVFISSSPFMVDDDIVYPLEISIHNPNGNTETILSGNTISTEVFGITYIPERKVVGEEGTGTWCGFCPRGTVALDSMEVFYSDEFIGIAVHNSDPMAVAEYDNGLGFQSFPNGIINRRLEIPPSRFKDGLNLVSEEISPLAITIAASVDEENRMLSATITTESVTQLTDRNYKLSVIVTEDGVTGTTDDYNQVNEFSGLAAGTLVGVDGVDWTTLPNPVLAADMVYDHVGRALLGGFDGVSGALSDDIRAGDIFTQEFSWTVPITMDLNELHVVGLILDEAGEIINATKSELSVITSSNNISDNSVFSVYPNPTSGFVNLDINVKLTSNVNLIVMNAIGRVISNESLGALSGAYQKTYDFSNLPSGIYIFKTTIDSTTYVEKIMVNR